MLLPVVQDMRVVEYELKASINYQERQYAGVAWWLLNALEADDGLQRIKSV